MLLRASFRHQQVNAFQIQSSHQYAAEAQEPKKGKECSIEQQCRNRQNVYISPPWAYQIRQNFQNDCSLSLHSSASSPEI